MMDLSNRVAIVTGAGRGIGEAVAIRLASAGAQVAIVDIDGKLAETVAVRVRALGRKSVEVHCDVSSASSVAEMRDRVLSHLGSIEILVNNAGIPGKNAPLTEVSETDWDLVMNVDRRSVYLSCKAVLPYMLEHKSGKIVNVASVAGKEGNPNMVAYSTAKAGVIGFTKALAKEVVRSLSITHKLSFLVHDRLGLVRGDVERDVQGAVARAFRRSVSMPL